MESKLLISMQGLVLSLLFVSVASSTSNEASLISDWESSVIPGSKPLLPSPLSTSIEINQAAATGGAPSFAGSLCQTFASQFGGTIVNYLKQNNNPQQVCSNFGICMPTSGAVAGSGGAGAATGGAGAATGGFGFSLMLCGPCQMAVTMMQANLNNQQSQNQNAPPGSMVGSKLCQSVSNLFRSPASVTAGQPVQVYNPMPVVQSVSGGNVNGINP